MSNRHEPTLNGRRGAALLLVLAALILVTTAVAGVVRLTAVSGATENVHRSVTLADALFESATAPIENWLETESSQTVLSPDVEAPALEVLHDEWEIDGKHWEIRITAWDQCGMVPLKLARRGSPLRLTVPPEIRQVIDGRNATESKHPGLDQFVATSDGRGVRVFPEVSSDSGRAVGARVATHNEDPFRININTAPMILVEAALRRAGRGGVEAIRAARAKGAQATIGAAGTRGDAGDRALRLVGTSDLWSFRIDIVVHGVHRSWWSVYERGKKVSKPVHPWACIQRLLITE